MDQKIALITGANRGIGYEAAKQLVALGYKVIIAARNNAAREKVAAIGADFLQLDVTSETSIQQAALTVIDKYPQLDVLVNNAGVCDDDNKSVFQLTKKIFNRSFDTNFFGPLMLTQALVPALQKSKDARIINVSSDMACLTTGTYNSSAAYRLSKTALNSLTQLFSHELPPHIKINSMSPGWVKTDMGGEAAPRTVEQGAETIVWLSTVENIPTGKFWKDKQEIGW